MKNQITRVSIRLKAIFRIITKRNFILIHSIQEHSVLGQPGRTVAILSRTDYSNESDQLSCMAASKTFKKMASTGDAIDERPCMECVRQIRSMILEAANDATVLRY